MNYQHIPINYINIILQITTITPDILTEINVLRSMDHVNIVSIINDDNVTTQLENEPTLQKEQIYTTPIDLDGNINNNFNTNTILICYKTSTSEIIKKLNEKQINTDNLAILEYYDYNLIPKLLYGLQTCFRKPDYSSRQNYNSLYKDKNLLTIALPNIKNKVDNNDVKSEFVLLLENILMNSLKPSNFETLTVGLDDDNKINYQSLESNTQTAGGIRSKIRRAFGKKQGTRTKKLTKPKDLQKQTLTKEDLHTTKSGKHNIHNNGLSKNNYNNVSLKKEKLEKYIEGKKQINNNNFLENKLSIIIKHIDSDIGNRNYNFNFNYNSLHSLSVIDFILFTSVGQPANSTIKRYELLNDKFKAIKSGKLTDKTGKLEYTKEKKKRLSRTRKVANNTREKLTKKKYEARRKSKKDFIMEKFIETDTEYTNLIDELSKSKGIKNILKRKRLQKEIDSKIKEIMDRYNNNIANNTQTVTALKQKYYD